MDDLVGLDWSAPSTQSANKSSPMSTGNYYPSLRPTPPISGRSTPASQTLPNALPKPPSIPNTQVKASTSAIDSFANLLPFVTSQPAKALSLQDQQQLLQEQKARQELDRRKEGGKQVGSNSVSGWDLLENGVSMPGRMISPPTYTGTGEYGGQKLSTTINKPFSGIGRTNTLKTKRQSLSESESDLLAAFDVNAPVDSSSNFPIPSPSQINSNLRSVTPTPVSLNAGHGLQNLEAYPDEEEDDPFGLGMGPSQRVVQPASLQTPDDVDEDDVLGLLGRPVSKLSPPKSSVSASSIPSPSSSTSQGDRAIAELVDMGFTADKSRDALAATESGLDVQAAVGWILNQAHEESRKQKSGAGANIRVPDEEPDRDSQTKLGRTDSAEAPVPAWMRQQSRSSSTQRREDSRSPAKGDNDPAKYAAELGNNLFKTANSLWKTGTKKLNQAVAELNSDSDSSQPKWMREATDGRGDSKVANPRPQSRVNRERDQIIEGPKLASRPKQAPNITDEALLLESGNARPQPRSRQRVQNPRIDDRTLDSMDSSRDQSPSIPKPNPRTQSTQPRSVQEPSVAQVRSQLRRQVAEDENTQAYVSPARRKKAVPKPLSPEPDLLFDTSQRTLSSSNTQNTPIPSAPKPTVKQPAIQQTASRPPPPSRKTPPVSATALQASASHRQAGTAAFKLGNYADATASYTFSLSPLPSSHPLAISLLTNRALTHLKTGDPRASMSDCDAALEMIGPSKGQNEKIDFGGDEGSKDMNIFWGKAMMRKAEALEQLERWGEAAQVWKGCVEGGIGGSTSIQGRTRCEKAAGISQPAPTVRKAPPGRRAPVRPTPRPSALDDLSGGPSVSSASSAEAVTRLRAANAKAERVDDEKFALADSVDERLTKWRNGREGNLRALLGSLDIVLWEGSGWKKVGMSELIIPTKVKIVYMKGISKVHPDKLPTSATTEQVMISGAVFSILNEAWDRFKKENGL